MNQENQFISFIFHALTYILHLKKLVLFKFLKNVKALNFTCDEGSFMNIKLIT